MKSIEEQIKFIDTILLPFFGIKSIIDYESTFEITSEIDLDAFNKIIPDFRKIFPAKEFSLHKTKYIIETSNQALCILKKCMELIQLPYTIDTITKNKISYKQVRLIQTNKNLYNYIENKMSEIRISEIADEKNQLMKNIEVNCVLKTKGPSHDIKGDPPMPKTIVSPWMNSSIEPDNNIKDNHQLLKNLENIDEEDINEEDFLNCIKNIQISENVDYKKLYLKHKATYLKLRDQVNLKNPSYDIRGVPQNPKTIVSPWINSSIKLDPLYDLKPPKKNLTITNEMLHNSILEEYTTQINLSISRLTHNDKIIIPLQNHLSSDKYITSMKVLFVSKKLNGSNIISDEYINKIVNGYMYVLEIGYGDVVDGLFENGKELLPESLNSNRMILCNKILIWHKCILKIILNNYEFPIANLFDVKLEIKHAKINKDIEQDLYCTLEKKNISCVVEQLIKNNKQESNIARVMAGMGGNAYSEFLTKEKFERYQNAKNNINFT